MTEVALKILEDECLVEHINNKGMTAFMYAREKDMIEVLEKISEMKRIAENARF